MLGWLVVLGISKNSQENVSAPETCIIRLHFAVLSSQFSEKFKVLIEWPDLFNARMQIIVTLSAVYQCPQFKVIIINIFSVLSLKIRSSYNMKIEIEIEKTEKLTFFVRKSENNRLAISFSIRCGASDPLFTNLWALSTDFVLTQVNTFSYTPIRNYILPSLYNSGLL